MLLWIKFDNMPRVKRQKYKQEKASAMRAAKKKKALTGTTISPDSAFITNNTVHESKIDNDKQLTIKRNLQNVIHKLELKPREYTYHAKDSGNRLINWDSLNNMIRCNTKCARCGADVMLHEKTTGIATSVHLTCKNQRCNLNESNKINRTKFVKYNFRPDSNESFAINCQLVLSLMQMGCGSREADVLLTFLDLPNAHTFYTKTFSRVSDAIRSEIKEISNKSMKDAREEEIREILGEELFKKYNNGMLSPEEIGVVIMYDMGWNKRSSGNKYDSISGHGFALGGNTRKILNYRCMSKSCRKCFLSKRTKIEVEHECPKNHEGSSKSMECEAIFQIVKESFYDHGYTCKIIVSDDDSTMKSNLKHSFAEKVEKGVMKIDEWPRTKRNKLKSDNGRLPLDIPEPRFLADFNHRVKTVGKSVYALASLPKKNLMYQRN